MRLRRAPLLVSLLLVSYAISGGAASAATEAVPPSTFGAFPAHAGTTSNGHFRFHLAPGGSAGDALVVANYSATPLQVTLYGADMLPAISGGTAPAQADQTMNAVGSWIKLRNRGVNVPGRGEITDPFTITVPVGTAPGDHVGAIVASAIVANQGGTNIEVRVALLAEVFVPGVAHPSATVSALTSSSAGSHQNTYSIGFTNTGNVLYKVTGSVEVSGEDGGHLDSVAMTPKDAYVLPGETLQLKTGGYALPVGTGEVIGTVTANYLDGSDTPHSLTFTSKPIRVLNWWRIALQGGVLLALLLAITYVGMRLRRHFQRRPEKRHEAAVRKKAARNLRGLKDY